MQQQSQSPFAQNQASYGQGRGHAGQMSMGVVMDDGDMRIDPSLLLATANDPGLIDDGHGGHEKHDGYSYDVPGLASSGLGGVGGGEQQYESQYAAGSSQIAYTPHSHTQAHPHHSAQGVTNPIAVYFRLHPASEVGSPVSSRIWVATLNGASIGELRDLAVAKYPGTVLVRLEGVVKDSQTGGLGSAAQECVLQIDCDEELEAYLEGIGGVKPVFNVQLMGGWRGEEMR